MSEAKIHIISFNRKLKKIVCALSKKLSNDVSIRSLKNKIIIAINEAPVDVIDTAGPYIYDYRNQIYNSPNLFFSDNDNNILYKIDISKYHKNNYVDEIINKLRSIFKILDDSEKTEYINTITQILDSYIEYKCTKLIN